METETLQNEGPERWIRDAFIERKRKNQNYSLRSFARDLGMSPALLSLVLNRKKPLTLKQAHKVAALLQFSPRERKLFLNSALCSIPADARISKELRSAIDKQDAAIEMKSVDIERFHLISNWYHFAILDLTQTKGFRNNSDLIAKRIGISKPETEAAIERLIGLGLLEEKDGRLRKTTQHFVWTSNEPRAASRAFHTQMIDKAKVQLDKLDPESFSKRSIRGSSLPIDPKMIDEAKEFILKFEREFCRRFCKGEPEEVYQLNIQFFPLTNKLTPTEKRKLKS